MCNRSLLGTLGRVTLKPYYFSISLHSWNGTSGQAQREYSSQSWVRRDTKFSHLIRLYWNSCLKCNTVVLPSLWCWARQIQWEGSYFNRNPSYKINFICPEALTINWMILVFLEFQCSLVRIYLFISKQHLLFTVYDADHMANFLGLASHIPK